MRASRAPRPHWASRPRPSPTAFAPSRGISTLTCPRSLYHARGEHGHPPDCPGRGVGPSDLQRFRAMPTPLSRPRSSHRIWTGSEGAGHSANTPTASAAANAIPMPIMRSRPIAVPLRCEAHRRWGSRRLINAVPDALVPRAGRAAAARILVRRRGERPHRATRPAAAAHRALASLACCTRCHGSTGAPNPFHDRSPLKGRYPMRS